MNTYILLLRGINVGGNNILPMKVLTSILVDMGMEDIQTYIQSGNVVFRSKKKCTGKTAEKITACIHAIQGFTPHALLLTLDELTRAVAHNPFSATDGKTLHYFFLAKHPETTDFQRLDAITASSERYELDGRVCYLYAPDGIGRSRFVSNFDKMVGEKATARNWNTIKKLMEMAGAAA